MDGLQMQVPGGTGTGGGYSTVQDEGVDLTARTKINFTGAGVTATDSGVVTTVTIPGAAGASWTTVEANLGSSATWRGTFTITDASISSTSKVIVLQAPGPYTGKGTRADEAEMDQITCIAFPGTGSATVYWRTQTMLATTFHEVRGQQPISGVNTQHGTPIHWAPIQRVLGRVKGNVKFNYTVA